METLQEKKQNKIYAIYSETLGQCYIGSTSAYIWNRLLTHRAHFYQYKRRMNNTKQYDFHLQIYSLRNSPKYNFRNSCFVYSFP